jgi:hypothetical protein
MSLGSGSAIDVNSVARDSLLMLAREISNSELYASLLNGYCSKFTVGEVLGSFCDDSIEFVASEFDKLNTSDLEVRLGLSFFRNVFFLSKSEKNPLRKTEGPK